MHHRAMDNNTLLVARQHGTQLDIAVAQIRTYARVCVLLVYMLCLFVLLQTMPEPNIRLHMHIGVRSVLPNEQTGRTHA